MHLRVRNRFSFTLFGLVGLLILSTCTRVADREPAGALSLPDAYHQELEAWKSYRIGRLTEPTGWLRMIDLIDLPQRASTFGSGDGVDLRFPEGTVPQRAGTLHFDGEQVRMESPLSGYWRLDGEPFEEGVIFREGEEAPHVQSDRLHWFVDPQPDRMTLRLYDQTSEKAARFDGFPYFDVDPSWHLEAKLIPWEEPTFVEVGTIRGDRVEMESAGELQFRANGKLHSLIAFESESGLFLIFSDHTGRDETFPPMRYLIAEHPDDEGWTVIDFNRAYNPPCAFSPFTTCRLPPPENRLDLTIRAGEKRPSAPYAVTPPAALRQ